MEFRFSLKFRLGHEPRLSAWRPEGVTVLPYRHGRMKLEVCRHAPSALAAMRRTIRETRRRLPSTELIEAAPDYVSLREVAQIFRVSRQAMRQRMLACGRQFPAPVHEINGGIWHLAEMLEWMGEGAGVFFNVSLLDTARAAAEINLGIERRRAQEVRHRTWPLIDLPRRVERNRRTQRQPLPGG